MQKLYIERPDQQGNCGYLISRVFDASPCVIQAVQVPSNGLSDSLDVVAPDEFKKKWPSVAKMYFIEVIGVQPGKISWEEHKELYQAFKDGINVDESGGQHGKV